MTPEKIGFRFTRIYTPAVLLFVFCNALAGPFLVRFSDALWLHILVATLAGFSVLLGSAAIRRILLDTDEYIRKVTMDALLIAIVLTLTVTSVYGYLETYSFAPSLSYIVIAPAFVTSFAIVTAIHIAMGKYK